MKGCRIISNKFLREKVFHFPHPSGLDIFHLPKAAYQRKFAMLATRYGSLDNTFKPTGSRRFVDVPTGIAHFLEHSLFQMPDGNVYPRFSQAGADANAFTSYSVTAYQFGSTSRFYSNLRTLIEFVFTPYFADEHVERERKIIEQEIRMYDDKPGWVLSMNLIRAMYRKNPVRLDTAGTVDSITRITPRLLETCHRTFYHPANMSLVMSGNIDFKRAVDVAGDVIAGFSFPSNGQVARKYPTEPSGLVKKSVVTRLPVSSPKFQLGFKDIDIGYDGDPLLRREMITAFALELALGRGTALYAKLYRKRLIDDTFYFAYSGEERFGHTVIGGDTPRPDDLKAELFEAIVALRRRGFEEADLVRLRKKALGKFLRNFDSVEGPAMHYLLNHFQGICLFDFVDTIRSITLDDLHRRIADHFVEKRSVVSVVLPT